MTMHSVTAEQQLFSPVVRRFWIALMTLMAITGMGQMPIFKRYYVADIPGLGWLADPFVVHWVHYLGAAVLMAIVAWVSVVWMARRASLQFSANRWIRVVLLGLIIVTGYMRVAKNLPDFYWNPVLTMLVDWSHLAFAALLGVAALWGRKRN